MRVRQQFILRSGLICFISMALLSSCSGGEHPFLMTQICISDDAGVELFKQELQSIARAERMRYIDRSRESERELKALGVLKHPDGKHINVSIRGNPAAPSLGASNYSLYTYDVVVGFSRGSDQKSATEFSRRVIARLSQHWASKPVPSGTGAFPNPDCTLSKRAPPN
jgi:hypothetical protein